MSINFECQQKCSSCFSYGLEQVINEYVTKIYSPGDKSNGAIKILIVPLCNSCENGSGKCWDDFVKAFLNGGEKLNNYAGILFFTFENSVKGDFAGSIFNKSRMLREFFMCSVPAVTCDYSNILDGIKKLLIKIKNGEKKDKTPIETALGNLNQLKEDVIKKGKNLGINSIEDLSNIYACSEFHTRKTHTSLRKISKMLEDSSPSDDFKKKFKEEYYDVRKKYDIASIIASNPLRYSSLKILVIDDNPSASASRLEEDFKEILPFFPTNTEIHILEEDEYRKFLDADLWKKLLKRDKSAEIKVKILNLVNGTQINEKNDRQTFFDENGKFVYTHIVVDLLIDDYNFGNRIIRELVKFRSYVDTDESREPVIFDIFVYSLSDDIEDITRAFDEGARGYIRKFGRIYSLPALIAKTEDGREKIFGKRKSSVFWKTRNFGKLYHLPHTVIRKLQFTAFLEPIKDCNDEQELQQLMEISKKLSRKWIKDIPKAELHFHLGGAMDEDLIFNLAVNTVRHMKKGLEKKTWERGEKDENFEKVRAIVKEYADNYKQHFEKAGSQGRGNNRGETGSKTLQDWLQSSGNIEKLEEKIKDLKFFPALWETFDQEIKKNDSCTEQNKAEHPGKIIEDWLCREKNLYKEKDKHKKIETVLNDSPEDVFQILSFYIKEYCRIKVSTDDLISLFLVELGSLEGRKEEEIGTFWKDTLIFLDENDRVIQEIKGRMKKEMNPDNLYCVANFLSDECSKCFREFNKLGNKPGEPKKGLIRSLINARERGSDKSKGLAEYMIGSAFTGACHLQYYENIVAAVAYLVSKWVGDCVRYLEIRCSPTGYTSKELDLDRAVQALFDGADGMSRYLYLKKGEFIWTNFIISAKRHKSPYTMAQDIATVVMKRKLATKQDDEDINVLPERLPVSLYQWKRSKIVGIDLAGLETGFRASSFVEDFAPIFKVCSFLTIHAGEEDTEQSIWEAVYKLHANRIGHGLSLKNHPFLMEMARDLQICMELCPTSNCMTRIFKEEDHPFYIYVTEGLNVTINTDDPAWSGTVLSDEYVKAGELYYLAQKDKSEDEKQPLSLWDVLRIVKHGFKSAFISRKEKRTLLRSVEEEVYQKVLWKESVEFSLPELDEK